jgi:histidinol phosphatase-like enzyme
LNLLRLQHLISKLIDSLNILHYKILNLTKSALMEFVTHKREREVTYCKRKKHLLKKLIEISQLCDLDIFLVIFDKSKQKLLEFRSELNFNTEVVKELLAPEIKRNMKYDLFINDNINFDIELDDKKTPAVVDKV